jgi:hypothetical protein
MGLTQTYVQQSHSPTICYLLFDKYFLHIPFRAGIAVPTLGMRVGLTVGCDTAKRTADILQVGMPLV